MRTFHLLVANTLVANVTTSFLWFALTFWVYLETRSVFATAIIGGGYMLFIAVSAMFFGTFVDRHLRRTSMLLSSAISLVPSRSPASSTPSRRRRRSGTGHPAFWAFIVLVLVRRDCGQPSMVALSTTVTLLVPEDGRDRANGLVGTANGVVFAMTSVLSGFGVGLLGMGWSMAVAVVATALVAGHLLTIRIPEEAPGAQRRRAALRRLRRRASAPSRSCPG